LIPSLEPVSEIDTDTGGGGSGGGAGGGSGGAGGGDVEDEVIKLRQELALALQEASTARSASEQLAAALQGASAATSTCEALEDRAVAAEEARAAADLRANQAAVNATKAMSELRSLRATLPAQHQQQQRQRQVSDLQAQLELATSALEEVKADADAAAARGAAAEATALAAKPMATQERAADGRVMILKWMLASTSARHKQAREALATATSASDTFSAALFNAKHTAFKAEAAALEARMAAEGDAAARSVAETDLSASQRALARTRALVSTGATTTATLRVQLSHAKVAAEEIAAAASEEVDGLRAELERVADRSCLGGSARSVVHQRGLLSPRSVSSSRGGRGGGGGGGGGGGVVTRVSTGGIRTSSPGRFGVTHAAKATWSDNHSSGAGDGGSALPSPRLLRGRSVNASEGGIGKGGGVSVSLNSARQLSSTQPISGSGGSGGGFSLDRDRQLSATQPISGSGRGGGLGGSGGVGWLSSSAGGSTRSGLGLAAPCKWDELRSTFPAPEPDAAAAASNSTTALNAHSTGWSDSDWTAGGSSDWQLLGLHAKLATALKTDEDLRKRVVEVEAAAAAAAARWVDQLMQPESHLRCCTASAMLYRI
jgi:chemotaxis protein histidine kinase CheA